MGREVAIHGCLSRQRCCPIFVRRKIVVIVPVLGLRTEKLWLGSDVLCERVAARGQ